MGQTWTVRVNNTLTLAIEGDEEPTDTEVRAIVQEMIASRADTPTSPGVIDLGVDVLRGPSD